jgi:hypothetical protein
MKKLGFLLSVFYCFNLNAQKGDIYLCSWNAGQSEETEISAEKFSCNKKGKICYFIANDNDNILLSMRIEDVLVQNRILKEGMTIWISMDGKQTRNMGIRYPVGSQRSSGQGRNGAVIPKTNPDGSIVTPLSMAKSIELIGFTSESERRLPSENADSFNGFVKYDKDGILNYRLVIPVSKIPIRNSKDSDGSMPFTLGVEYGESISPGGGPGISAPPPSSGGGGSRGGGRGGGGGMAGGGGQGGNSSFSVPAPKPPVIVWIKNIKLATGK